MIEYHADDYGLFYEQSKRILDCIQNGLINGISIMPNSKQLDGCMELLKDLNVELTIHFNLVEGEGVCKTNKIIVKNNIFNISFGKLLFFSYVPFFREKYKNEIMREFKAQVSRVEKYFIDRPFRFDSHCHIHMIPVVFDAMMEVIKEEELQVSYIRMPKEKVSLYLKRGKKDKISPINFVKVIVLNLLCLRNKIHYGDYIKTINNMNFVGVMYSGNMNYTNAKYIIKHLNPSFSYEILFHPGAVYENEDIVKLTSKNDVCFLTSDKRAEEAKATKLLKKDTY